MAFKSQVFFTFTGGLNSFESVIPCEVYPSKLWKEVYTDAKVGPEKN